jgi:uncharacterized protein
MRELWINLIVKDLQASKPFYQQLGFVFNPRFEQTIEVASLLFNDKSLSVMLFEETFFHGKLPKGLSANTEQKDTLLSISADSVEDADLLVEKAIQAGGKKLSDPAWSGQMYNTGFIDLDGHWWNILYYKIG